MKFTIGSISALIDTEGTRKAYKSLENHGRDNSATFNFIQNMKARETAVRELFGAFGIDPYLFQNLHAESVNAAQQTVMYCGFYPLEAFNKDEILEIIDRRDEQESYSETTSTEIGFELAFENWNDQLAFYFEVNLPWLLTPEIAKGKYDNQTTLPEIDVRALELSDSICRM